MTNEQAIDVLNMVEAHGLADEAKKLAIKALQNDRPQGMNEAHFTRDQITEAINKYQEIHPLPYSIDVTDLRCKEDADIITATINKIMVQVNKDTEMYIVCEMAKAYMAGIKPHYEIRQHGTWVKSKDGYMRCSQCGSRGSAIKARFCHHCGADMRGDDNEQ